MAEIYQSAASLNVSSDELEIAHVSHLLEAEPDLAYEKRKERVLPNGNRIIAHTGLWSRSAEYRIPGDLDGQIAELFTPLSQDLDHWLDVSSRYRIRIFCGLWLKDENEGIDLDPQTLIEVALRNASIEFDIYSPVKPSPCSSLGQTEVYGRSVLRRWTSL